MPSSQIDTLYRLLMEQLPEGVIITDPEGVMLFVNSAAEQIRNVKREKLLGSSILGCHKESSRERVTRSIENLKAIPKSNYHRMVTDEINQKVYDNNYVSICDEEGAFKGLAVITRDITAQRRADELKAHYAQVQELALNNLRSQYHQLLMTSLGTLCNLLEAKDSYTNGHSLRVAEIAQRLYEYKNGLTGQYFDIQAAAKLHDIGKICIPDRIIDKPGKLTSEEYETIKQHSGIAADIIKTLDPDSTISSIVRHHHERFDGAGYPDHLAGPNIPLGSRIIAIADSFDAMSSRRPYRSQLPYEDCVREIQRNAGSQFDPEWVEVFLELARTGSI